MKEALEPLLEHRRAQAGPLFKKFDGQQGLRADLRAADWLRHAGVGVGVGDVRQVPYYLMVVGDPEQLPFGVEFDLVGSSYAVGRLAFDTPDAYVRYACNVVRAETAPPRRPARFTFVGMEHPDDITQESQRYLVRPLVERYTEVEGWDVNAVMGEAATKPKLAELLGGPDTPSVLFAAGHMPPLRGYDLADGEA
ncbi:MAG: hypothetical protein GY856_07385 [bacterium]|nr:hypothetical protein [bacterium]